MKYKSCFDTGDAQDLIRNPMGEEQMCNSNHNILRLNIPADTKTSHAVTVNIKKWNSVNIKRLAKN